MRFREGFDPRKFNEHLEVIPAWEKIKKETLDSFYIVNSLLNQFRLLKLDKVTEDARKVALKNEIEQRLKSEIVNFYAINRSLILTSAKVKKTMKKSIKVLDRYSLNTSKLSLQNAVKYFYNLQAAYHLTGLLDLRIKVDKSDPSSAFVDGM